MNERVRLRLGPVTFWGHPQFAPKPVGFMIGKDGLDGISDGVDVRRDSIPLPAAHGSYDLPGYLDSRVMSISGFCIAETEHDLGRYGAILRGLLAQGDSGRIVAEQLGETRSTQVRLASKPKFVPRPKPYRLDGKRVWVADFQLQLWAADPRWYGVTAKFSGAHGAFFDVWQYGNFPAAPVITVTGSYGGMYAVYGPSDRRWLITGGIAAGHPHVLDMRTGRLLIDGQVVFGRLAEARRWAIPPGVKATHHLDCPGASMTIAVTDTSI